MRPPLSIIAGLCILLGAIYCFFRPAPAPVAPTPMAAHVAAAPAPPQTATLPSVTAADPEAAPSLPAGITAVWRGRFPVSIRDFIAGQDTDNPVPSQIELPVNDRERVKIRFSRIDFNGTDAATLIGEAEGKPGSTVVVSHVGASQAGIIYLPGEKRSFVISGGEDGNVRVTETDLTRAPGCTPPLAPPRLARSRPLSVPSAP